MRSHHSLTLAAVLAAALLAPRQAGAQIKIAGFALERFAPSAAGDAFFGVPSPWAPGHLVPRASLVFDYAYRPLHYDGGGQSTDIVNAQGFLRADVSLALWNRVLVAADLPVALVDGGNAPPAASGVDFHPPGSPAFGDARFDLRARILGDYHDPFQLGAGGAVYVPSGSREAYTGDGAVRGALHLNLGGRMGHSIGFVWSASGGALLRASGAHAVTFGAGAGLTAFEDRLQVGPEVYGSVELGGTPILATGTTIRSQSPSNLEVLLGVKARVASDLFVGAAAGPGPLDGVGTPAFRAVGMIGWAPLPRPAPAGGPVVPVNRDRDGDGIRDDIDACPDTAGELQADPSKDGCPIADRDGDRIMDIDDACPGIAGVRSADATKNGCPKDSDGDDIHDGIDACPDLKGVASADPRRNGCPPDGDGDGVADATDACPEVAGPSSTDPKWNGCPDDPDGDGIKGAADACPYEKGAADAEPRQNGCPRLVRVNKDEIVLRTKIRFRIDGRRKSETIDPLSGDLMREIRDVINEHPEITKIEVQGHTDDAGTEQYNQRLSQDRAEAVRAWLIDAGIPADKLVAKGYGFWKPAADNRINVGRTRNRRVQFIILERTSR
ncbi:MAG: OmpA family protein [Byssovorax sp.]